MSPDLSTEDLVKTNEALIRYVAGLERAIRDLIAALDQFRCASVAPKGPPAR